MKTSKLFITIVAFAVSILCFTGCNDYRDGKTPVAEETVEEYVARRMQKTETEIVAKKTIKNDSVLCVNFTEEKIDSFDKLKRREYYENKYKLEYKRLHQITEQAKQEISERKIKRISRSIALVLIVYILLHLCCIVIIYVCNRSNFKNFINRDYFKITGGVIGFIMFLWIIFLLFTK